MLKVIQDLLLSMISGIALQIAKGVWIRRPALIGFLTNIYPVIYFDRRYDLTSFVEYYLGMSMGLTPTQNDMLLTRKAAVKVECETGRNFINLSPEEIFGCAKREWQVVKNVLKTSFSSCERIKKNLRCIGVFDWKGQDKVLENMDRHFLGRHCLTHRGGRKIDGTQLIVSKDDLSIVIEDSNRLALTVMTLLER